MTMVKTNKKWRIVLPKNLRKSTRRAEHKIDSDSFPNDIKNPAHVDPQKIKKLDLEKLEEELWFKPKIKR